MRKIWQSLILVLATLYLTGCQPANLSASLENPIEPIAKEGSSAPIVENSSELVSNTEPVLDECLNCHADKARLVDTAEPVVESAESESSGVG